MEPAYEWGADMTVLRCPRCLVPWSPGDVDLDAEDAECKPCGLEVVLFGVVLPEWERDDVALRLDRVGDAPPLRGLVLTESATPRALRARGRGWLTTKLSLGAEGACKTPVLARRLAVPLSAIARVVPAARFAWNRDPSRNSKRLVPSALVLVALRGDEPDAGPTLEVRSWDAARYVAARFESVRRTLTETGPYR